MVLSRRVSRMRVRLKCLPATVRSSVRENFTVAPAAQRLSGRNMSLMPTSGHGDFFFRIKDDREANEWHDIMCRKAVPGQWAFICATYDVITHIGKMYFNGLMVGSRENMPNLKIVEQIIIGGDEYQNSYEGKLAGLEIHHYVLSAEQIEEKFRSYQQEPSFLGTDGRK